MGTFLTNICQEFVTNICHTFAITHQQQSGSNFSRPINICQDSPNICDFQVPKTITYITLSLSQQQVKDDNDDKPRGFKQRWR